MTASRPPGFEPRDRRGEKPGEGDELLVDLDPQRLEDAGGRIDLLPAPLLPRHDAGELASRLDGAPRPLRYDSARDLCRHSLLPIITENPCEFIDRSRRHDVGRRAAALSHAHVERSVPPEREAALASSSCIDETPRSARMPGRRERLSRSSASRSAKSPGTSATRSPKGASRSRARARASGSRSIPRRRTLGSAFEQGLRVAAGADRRVHEEPPALGLEHRGDLVEKNGCVRPRFNRLRLLAHEQGASKARRSPRDRTLRSTSFFASAPRSETTR